MAKSLEERMKAAVKGLEDGLVDLKAIIAEAEAAVNADDKARKLPDDVKEKLKAAGIGHPEIPKEGGALLVKDVTIAMVREKATEYAEIFGMDKLLALNVKFGKSKKLSGIDPTMFGVVYGAMDTDIQAAKKLAEAGGDKKPAATPAITLADVRTKAAEFLAKSGEPAFKAVLKAFGAEKLSGVPAEKYPALLEAIGNA